MPAADRPPPRRATASYDLPVERPHERLTFAGWLRGAFLENLGIKFIAFVLALTVFILVHSAEDQTVGAEVRVAYTMPEDRVLVSGRTDAVTVTARGSWRQIKRFDEDALEPIRIDLRKYKNGELRLREDMVRLPPGLELESITPSVINLEFEPMATKTVPIEAEFRQEPGRGYGVAEVTVRRVNCDETAEDCASVTIAGAQSYVEATEVVPTEEIPLTGRTASFATIVGVTPPRPHVEIVGNPQVQVHVNLVEQLTTREIGTLPVDVRAGSGAASLDPRRFQVEPSQVHVVLRGGRLAVEQLEPSAVKAYVNVFADDAQPGRERPAPVAIEGVPRGVATEVRPRDVTVRSPQPTP